MNQKLELYHGADGDKILKIIADRSFQPDSDHHVYFSRNNPASVLMHGGDEKRRKTFAIKALVEVPGGAFLQNVATPGVLDTLIVTTHVPLPTEVLELYVRELRGMQLQKVIGVAAILAALKI